jgi:IclR family transcriptional regulator, mhp operon transcriptional activator
VALFRFAEFEFRFAERRPSATILARAHGSRLVPKEETIQGLERGLQVLEALRESASSSLRDLHLATGISKPSLLRILNTLCRGGYVVRRVADRHYRISAFNQVGRKPDRHDRVVEAAGPVLDRLCRKVLWPSDLLVPAGGHMERRETSQLQSPFFPHPGRRDRVGQSVGWLLTGVGRAYLAFCPEDERTRILNRLVLSDQPDDQLAKNRERMAQILAQTRERGYGTRDPIFTGGAHGAAPIDDRLAAIAVPLQGRRRVYGSINLLWIKTAFTVEDFAAQHLADLQAAARDIVCTLETANRPAAPAGPFRQAASGA